MPGPKRKPRWTPAPSLTLTDLEQIRVLAAPLRVRILESLCAGEHTTKQIAERLGEKPTRLYHHVEALERVGLIRQTRTRQVRGTVEKYFQAVARSFRAEAGLGKAEGAEAATGTLADIARTVFRNTTDDLLRLLRSGHDAVTAAEGMVVYTEVHASAKEIDAVRRKLQGLLKAAERRGRAVKDERRYRLTVAFFPLDLDER